MQKNNVALRQAQGLRLVKSSRVACSERVLSAPEGRVEENVVNWKEVEARFSSKR